MKWSSRKSTVLACQHSIYEEHADGTIEPIAVVFGGDDESNVPLIAAAPDMLDALRLVADAYGFDPSVDSGIWKTVFATIAKAEGRS